MTTDDLRAGDVVRALQYGPFLERGREYEVVGVVDGRVSYRHLHGASRTVVVGSPTAVFELVRRAGEPRPEPDPRSVLERPPLLVPTPTPREEAGRRIDRELADAYLAGHLVLLGAAQASVAVGRRLATLRIGSVLAAIDEYEAAVREGGGDVEVGPDPELSLVSISRALVASDLQDVADLLYQAPDWRSRAIRAEADLEQSEFSLANLRDEVRRAVAGVDDPERGLRYALETLRGEVLAAEVRERECAALAVAALECLARVPTAAMPSDLEAQAHAVLASPRTRETEAAAAALVDRVVEARFAQRLVAHGAVVEGLERELELRAERIRSATAALEEGSETIAEAREYVGALQRESAALQRVVRWGPPVALGVGLLLGYWL